MVAAGDPSGAQEAAEELEVIAAELGSPMLRAQAVFVTGTVLLERGDAAEALSDLRESFRAWSHVDAPYEAARARTSIGLACRLLEDHETADAELRGARRVFVSLGAASEVQRVDEILVPAPTLAPGGLTKRELEVLRLVAAGGTNRAIATDLFISEKTVARHVSNIFAKLDVSSRAGATAYAFQNDIV